MATATFYTTAKRHNSTLVPSADAGTDLNVNLKDGCDILAPVFLLSRTAPPIARMVKFEDRYYFVTDIIYVRNNLYEIRCEVDVLATYKSVIQGTTAYVMYASGSDTEIIDHRLSIKTTPTFSAAAGAGFPHVSKYGKYVLTIVGDSTTASYVCTYDQVRNLLASLADWYHDSMPLPDLETDVVTQLKEAGDALIMGIRQLIATGNAGDNIKNAMFIPLSDGAFSGKTSTRRVYMGEYNTGIDLPAITDRHFAESISFTIPWQATGWRRNAPYHELYLVVPTLGVIQLPVSDLIDCDTINVELAIDLISGDAKIIVYTGNLNRQIGIYGVNYGAQYAIGASNVTPMSMATSILSGAAAGVAAAASGGITAAAIGANWASGVMNNIAPNPTCIGGNGGSAAIGSDVRLWLYSIFHDTVVAPSSVSTVMGVPKMQTMSLASQTGYIQTLNASVAGSMTDTERQRINTMMDGGIYIE